ncbi:IclR family transcriptional regulator [Streptomyces apricus]|uniref:Helix-turn-helix domain-containing protein n=1 Tax=Streptomyces apricus TaxID=1828112 RepID=A0A5B0BIS7_9ACTN|nr:helix-turn-helix domain-containing protein [Streptomyces apricus]KAA0941152.1 helix-turn-helix domain-containing protein [Streptomyces apricus]
MRDNGGQVQVHTGGRPPAGSAHASGRTPAHGAGRSVLAGAFELLAAVERSGGAGLTRLSWESGLPKTTVHRLLDQLIDLGTVERCADGYRIGPRMFQLGNGWQPHPKLRAAAAGPARRLAAVTGAAVGLAVLRYDRTLVLGWTPGGTRSFPALCGRWAWPWYTAAGKVLAAAPSYRFPPSAVPASWAREERFVRERGVAVDQGVMAPGVCSVAAPLHDVRGVPVAALFAATRSPGPSRLLADAVRSTGAAIGAGLAERRG